MIGSYRTREIEDNIWAIGEGFLRSYLMVGQEESFYLNQANVEDFDYRPVENGQLLTFNGRKMQVIYLPGHTPGSIILFDRDYGYLFSGDTIAESAIYLFGRQRN